MKLFRWLIVSALLAGGCQRGGAPAPDPVPEPATAASEPDEPEPAPPGVDCGPEIPGLAPLLEPEAILLFGEMHGTVEAPRFVGRAACLASASGRVLVGLEVPLSLQPALEVFHTSEDLASAREALLGETFWSTHDGRSSEAMLELLERLRALRRAGRDVAVFTLDGSLLGAAGRDRGMGERIVEVVRAEGDATVLVLTGNLHARTSEPRWMGWYVKEAFPRTRALDIAYKGGRVWICTGGGCGETPVRGRDLGLGLSWRVETFDAPDENGFHGIYYVGALTASPPARGGGTGTVSQPGRR